MRKRLLTTAVILTGGLVAFNQAEAQQNQAQQQGQVYQQEQQVDSGATLTLSTATVRAIKQQLNQRGYDPGNINGQWDQQARQALQNFQKSQGLEPTGQLNNRALALLGISPPGVYYGMAPQYGPGPQYGWQYGGGWQQRGQMGPGMQRGYQGQYGIAPRYRQQQQFGIAPQFGGPAGQPQRGGMGMQRQQRQYQTPDFTWEQEGTVQGGQQ